MALRLKRVCYKVFLFENYQRQSGNAFIGLNIHVKIICGVVSYLNVWVKVTKLERNRLSRNT